jgi:hypothetical protein
MSFNWDYHVKKFDANWKLSDNDKIINAKSDYVFVEFESSRKMVFQVAFTQIYLHSTSSSTFTL